MPVGISVGVAAFVWNNYTAVQQQMIGKSTLNASRSMNTYFHSLNSISSSFITHFYGWVNVTIVLFCNRESVCVYALSLLT